MHPNSNHEGNIRQCQWLWCQASWQSRQCAWYEMVNSKSVCMNVEPNNLNFKHIFYKFEGMIMVTAAQHNHTPAQLDALVQEDCTKQMQQQKFAKQPSSSCPSPSPSHVHFLLVWLLNPIHLAMVEAQAGITGGTGDVCGHAAWVAWWILPDVAIRSEPARPALAL